MDKVRFTLPPELTLEAIAAYQDDVIASLYLYFSPASPTFVVRFAGLSLDEVALELESRLVESETR